MILTACRACGAGARLEPAVEIRCACGERLSATSGPAALFESGPCFVKPPAALWQLALEFSWLAATGLPWVALGWVLARVPMASWLATKGWGAKGGLWVDPRPFADEAAVANLLATLGLIPLLVWRWRRATIPRPARIERAPWIPPLVALVPACLLAGLLYLETSAQLAHLEAKVLGAGLPLSAWIGTLVIGSLLLAITPLMLHVGLTRWLGSRYGMCEIGPDQVAFATVDGRGLRVVAKRDLGRREESPRGVRVDVLGGAVLIPAPGEDARAEVLRLLDEFDGAASETCKLPARRSRRGLLLTSACVWVAAAAGGGWLGAAWIAPAAALGLVIAGIALVRFQGQVDVCLDAPHVHQGTWGLLADRWLAWTSVRATRRVGEHLAIESTQGHFLLDLREWPPARIEELEERLGQAPPDAAWPWAQPARRLRAQALTLFLLSILLGAALSLIRRPPFPAAVLRCVDDAANPIAVVSRLGDRDALLLLGAKPEHLTLSRDDRVLGSWDGHPITDFEVFNRRSFTLQRGGGPWVALPSTGVAVVNQSGALKLLEATPERVRGLALELWWRRLSLRAPVRAISVTQADLRRLQHPLVSRFVDGYTGRGYGVAKNGDEFVTWVAESGKVWAIGGGNTAGKRIPSLRAHIALGRRMSWTAGRRLRVDFRAPFPSLDALIALRDAPNLRAAARKILPFWNLPTPPSRRAQRALAHYFAYGRWWGGVALQRQLLRRLGQDRPRRPWGSRPVFRSWENVHFGQWAEAALLELLHSPLPAERDAGAVGLAGLEPPLAYETWLEIRRLSEDPSNKEALAAVFGSALVGGEIPPTPWTFPRVAERAGESWAILSGLLGDPSPEVRKAARWALVPAGRRKEHPYRRAIVHALKASLRDGCAAFSRVTTKGDAWEELLAARTPDCQRFLANRISSSRELWTRRRVFLQRVEADGGLNSSLRHAARMALKRIRSE